MFNGSKLRQRRIKPNIKHYTHPIPRNYMTLEVCTSNFKSAIAALEGGAHRIELCENLIEGGTTPSLGMIRAVKKRLNLPVFVLIRPRGGNFCYTPDEFAIMQEDLHICREEGVEGVVFGALLPNGTIDTLACQGLLEAAKGMETTFHRAFDEVPNMEEAIEILVSLGFSRILTSGQKDTALAGVPNLAQLVRVARGRIGILPGGGISPENAVEILQKTGVKELHASLRRTITTPTGKYTSWQATDRDAVQRLLKITENASKI